MPEEIGDKKSLIRSLWFFGVLTFSSITYMTSLRSSVKGQVRQESPDRMSRSHQILNKGPKWPAINLKGPKRLTIYLTDPNWPIINLMGLKQPITNLMGPKWLFGKN